MIGTQITSPRKKKSSRLKIMKVWVETESNTRDKHTIRTSVNTKQMLDHKSWNWF